MTAIAIRAALPRNLADVERTIATPKRSQRNAALIENDERTLALTHPWPPSDLRNL
jgi:hypothetical protein